MTIFDFTMKDGLLSKVLRGAGTMFCLRLVGLTLGYAAQVVLARLLGAHEYGKFAYVIALATLLSVVAQMGLSTTVLRFIPLYIERNEFSQLRGMVFFSWFFVAVIGVFITLITMASASWLGAYGSPYAEPLFVGAWMVPVLALCSLQAETLRATHSVGWAYAPEAVLRPLLLLFLVFASVRIFGQASSATAVLAAALAIAIVLVVQLPRLTRSINQLTERAKPVYESREWMRVSLPLFLVAAFLVVLNQSDVLMVGAFLGPEQAGIYAAASKVAMLVSLVLVAINAIAAPMFVRLHAKGDRIALQCLVTKLAHWAFWPSAVCALAILLLSDGLLNLFGAEFVVGQWALTVLIVGQLVNAGAGSVGYLIDLTGHHKVGARVRGYCALLNIVLNAALIPLWGIEGAAIATAVTLALWNVWLHRLVSQKVLVKTSIISALQLKGVAR